MAAATSVSKTKSEDVLGEKFDRCLVDTGAKMATGLAVGKFLAIFESCLFVK